MFTLIQQSGLYGIILAGLIIIAIVYLFIAVRSLVSYSKENYGKTEESINNILRVGILSGVLGFTGTIHGGYLALVAIKNAGNVSMEIVYGGLICALSSTLLGLEVFVFASVIWFVLRNIMRRMELQR